MQLPEASDCHTASYTRVLVRDAIRLSPKLLLMMESHQSGLSTSEVEVRGVMYPAVTDGTLNITVIIDPSSMLPYIIRAYEDHQIFGPSVNDLVVYNYTSLGGVQLPRRLKYMYNEENMLFDCLIGDVQINPTFTSGFFNGLPLSNINATEIGLPPSAPTPSTEYGNAEVFEFRLVSHPFAITSIFTLVPLPARTSSGMVATRARFQTSRSPSPYREFQSFTTSHSTTLLHTRRRSPSLRIASWWSIRHRIKVNWSFSGLRTTSRNLSHICWYVQAFVISISY